MYTSIVMYAYAGNVVLFICECICRSTVRMVASDLSGMGKSLYIERLAEKLEKQCQIKNQHIIIPIHGPVVNADTVMASLCNHVIGETPIAQIIHFDIASSVSSIANQLITNHNSILHNCYHICIYTFIFCAGSF